MHVTAVARRLDRYLPSQWQERVKAGDRRDYDTWLRVVLDPSDEFDWDRQNVWFSHDVGSLVARWVEVVGADRFTLIVSDEADRELLPRSFETMLGLPGGTLKPDPTRSNRGLTWAETELVRAVNEILEGQGWSRAQRRRYSSAASWATCSAPRPCRAEVPAAPGLGGRRPARAERGGGPSRSLPRRPRGRRPGVDEGARGRPGGHPAARPALPAPDIAAAAVPPWWRSAWSARACHRKRPED